MGSYFVSVVTHTAQQVLIDGVVKWSKTTAGTYLNQSVDSTSYPGLHTVSLQMYRSISHYWIRVVDLCKRLVYL